jgi:hypothetical protein
VAWPSQVRWVRFKFMVVGLWSSVGGDKGSVVGQ